MALSYRAGSFQSAGGASTASTAVNKPAGGASGDVFVTAVYLETDTNTITTVPSGWTLLFAEANTAAFKLHTYAKLAGGSEPASYTWGFNVAGFNAVVTGAYSGGTGTGTLLDLANGAQADAAITSAQTAPSITTTGADRMLVFAFGTFAGTTVTGTSGAASNYRGQSAGTALGDALRATAGATGTSAPTGTGTEDYAAIHAAIISDTGGGAAGPFPPWPRPQSPLYRM